jgi:hypothetical protein
MKRDTDFSRDYTAANPKQDKAQTDWLAWSLQLVFGFVVGFGASFPMARILFRVGLIRADQMFLAMFGGACCCGAFASYYGNRAWMRTSLFDAPEPPRTELSKKWSFIIGGFGVLLTLLPVVSHLYFSNCPETRTHSGEFRMFKLLLAAIPGGLLFHALRTGSGFWRFGELDRHETPLFFWIYVVGMAILLCGILFGR